MKECDNSTRKIHINRNFILLDFFNNFITNEDIATKFEADLPHCVRNVKEKNVLLFKFRCNIFIGVRIINP